MLDKVRRWRERRRLEAEIRSLPIPPGLELPPGANITERPALVSRQDVRAVAATVAICTAALLPVAGWGAYAAEVYEDRAAHAEAEQAYSEALAAFESARAVELSDAPEPSSTYEAVERLAAEPTTEPGREAAEAVAAAEARVEATEPETLGELWPL